MKKLHIVCQKNTSQRSHRQITMRQWQLLLEVRRITFKNFLIKKVNYCSINLFPAKILFLQNALISISKKMYITSYIDSELAPSIPKGGAFKKMSSKHIIYFFISIITSLITKYNYDLCCKSTSNCDYQASIKLQTMFHQQEFRFWTLVLNVFVSWNLIFSIGLSHEIHLQ